MAFWSSSTVSAPYCWAISPALYLVSIDIICPLYMHMIPEILKLLRLYPDKHVKDILSIITGRWFQVVAVENRIFFMLMELPQNVSKKNVLMESCSGSQTAKNITHLGSLLVPSKVTNEYMLATCKNYHYISYTLKFHPF